MSIESNLEQTLFERGAEKCDSKDSRLAFCKAYLEKHGALTKETINYTPVENSLIAKDYGNRYGMRETAEITVLHVRKIIDNYTLSLALGTNAPAMLENMKVELAEKLLYDLVKNNRIHFEVFKHPSMDATEVHAAIKVADWKR